MRINHKACLAILSSICVMFFSQITFAQNTEEVKSEIYSKLRDRRCDMPLTNCNCPDAKEMKGYIDALIETGVGREDIFYKVAKKFSLNLILDNQIRQEVEKRLVKEAGQNHPQIFLESTSFDFGSVSKKQGKISKIFKLSNKGNSLLVIKNIKTSCPCATVSLKADKKKTPYFGTDGAPENWQTEIKPQETQELELMVDLSSQHVKTGKLIREASVFSNDPVYPEVKVRIETEVNE